MFPSSDGLARTYPAELALANSRVTSFDGYFGQTSSPPTCRGAVVGSTRQVVLAVAVEHLLILVKVVMTGLVDSTPRLVREAQAVIADKEKEERKANRRLASGLPVSTRRFLGAHVRVPRRVYTFCHAREGASFASKTEFASERNPNLDFLLAILVPARSWSGAPLFRACAPPSALFRARHAKNVHTARGLPSLRYRLSIENV